jgi:50S ribosomal subunit binding protein YggL
MSAPCPVFGFEVRAEIHPVDDDDRRAFWRALEIDFLVGRGLVARCLAFGGRLSFAVTSEASQATDADRQALEEWAAARPEILAMHVGPLVDLAAVA